MDKSWTVLAAQHRFLKKGVSGGSEPVILESSTKMVSGTITNSIPTNSILPIENFFKYFFTY